jgi:hypothetical protein
LLETGHISAEEVLMVIFEAKKHGVQHIVVTHAMSGPISTRLLAQSHRGFLLETRPLGVAP